MKRSEFLVTDPTIRKVFLFFKGLGNIDKNIIFPREGKGKKKKGENSQGKQGLVQSSWESSLLQPPSASVLCYQLVCRSSQALVLPLDVACEFKGLCLQLWQHRHWLAVPTRSFCSEESPSGDLFQ